MRLPDLGSFSSAFQKHGGGAAKFILNALLAPSPPPIARPSTSAVKIAPMPTAILRPTPEAAQSVPEHVPCKIYFPSIAKLSPAQREYYFYYRLELSRGNILPADLTYRFLYAYECAADAHSVSELDAFWSYLWRSYREDRHFAAYIASWIVDLRFLSKRYVVDDVLASHNDPEEKLDMILLAGSTPTWLDIVDALSADIDDANERIAGLLMDGFSDMESLMRLSRNVTAVSVEVDYFNGFPNDELISRLIASRSDRESFLANVAFSKPVETLIERACEAIGLPFTKRRGLEFVVSGSADVRVPIVREALPIRAVPAADTLEGLLSIIRHGASDDERLLLAVVLASSERLPHIDGRVDAAKTVRELFEGFGVACGRKVTLGNFRHAFFALSQGARAIWILEPPVADGGEIKLGRVVARFIRGLQHELSGTIARRAVLEAIIDVLASRTGRSKAYLTASLSACGASSSILPAVKQEAVT